MRLFVRDSNTADLGHSPNSRAWACVLLLIAALGSALPTAQFPTEWRIADAEAGGPAAMETWIALTNVSDAEGAVRIALFFADGSVAEKLVRVAPLRPVEILIGREFPSAAGRRFSVTIESLGNPAAEFHVDWATYSTLGGSRSSTPTTA